MLHVFIIILVFDLKNLKLYVYKVEYNTFILYD